MRYEVSQPLRTVTIHKAYAVYKDYGGVVSDSPYYSICATPELASKVAQYLNIVDSECDSFCTHHDANDNEIENNPFDESGYSWPYAAGYESEACWDYCTIEVERDQIATTLDEACVQVRKSASR